MSHSLWLKIFRISRHSKETTVILLFSVMVLIDTHENFTLLICIISLCSSFVCSSIEMQRILRDRSKYYELQIFYCKDFKSWPQMKNHRQSSSYSVIIIPRWDTDRTSLIEWWKSYDNSPLYSRTKQPRLTEPHGDNETDAWHRKVCLYSDSFKAWNSDTQWILRGYYWYWFEA